MSRLSPLRPGGFEEAELEERQSMAEGTQHAILVGVDGSPLSRLALDWAIIRAQAGGSTLWIVHVLEWPTLFDPYGLVAPWWEAVSLEPGQRILDEAVLHTRAVAPRLRVFTILRAGSPTDVIVHSARLAELVVLGRSRARGQFGRSRRTISERVGRRVRGRVVIVDVDAEWLA